MSAAEYEELRADSAHFAIVHGHDIPDVEHVVAERERYDVVRKDDGVARKIAQVTDPR